MQDLASSDAWLFSFWGKGRPGDGPVPSHPLVAHMLDVAAASAALAHRHPPDVPASTLALLVALHDIGKFSPAFQAKVPALWPNALGVVPASPPPDPGHDTIGLALLREPPIAALLDSVLPGWLDGQRVHLLAALAGHHGRPPADELGNARRIITPACRIAAQAFVSMALRLFAPAPLPLPDDERTIPRLAWQLAGLVTLADWIGSAQHWFPYAEPSALADPGAYFDSACVRARQAVAGAGIAPSSPSPFQSVQALFPQIDVSSPCQHWAETVAIAASPTLFIVEDLTGSGKTEAALTLAHRLLDAGQADGVFLALPTMATAIAMFERMAIAYRRMFAPGADPSLALAHGRAALHPGFSAALLTQMAEPGEKYSREPADEPAGAHCAAWLADDRRRTLLAQVGVGTIDQALLAVLPVRHAPLRLHGLAKKVLIVDEAHAFDPYMRRELVTLLRFHAALGGSAILLSATLPLALRQILANAFRDGLGAAPAPLCSTCYPLATTVRSDAVIEAPCEAREALVRRVRVHRLDDADDAIRRIVAAAKAGAAVAWVRNTVDDAIAAAASLRESGLAPILFHARFAMCDRLRIEAEVLRRFGRGTPAKRAGVLIATQVIEQSLDLDFDLLVTDLAPADLLIQRAGRLWRHQRGPRPVAGPDLLVVSPEPVAEPAVDWISSVQPGTAAVYRDPALLWRSARAVFAAGGIASPESMRPLIEEAGDDSDIPPGLATASARAEGKARSAAALAAMNVLDFSAGYRRGAGAWENDVDTPTRLQEVPHVTLRLARVQNGALVPYANDPDPARAWALSEVTVSEKRVEASPLPADLAELAATARKTWGRWEQESQRIHLAMIDESTNRLALVGVTQTRELGRPYYSHEDGLLLTASLNQG